MKRMLFFLINMNLGGTEKSFLNLLEQLSQKVHIDVLLLNKEGLLLNSLPADVNVLEIENSNVINDFIQGGLGQFILREIKRHRFVAAIKLLWLYIQEKLGRKNISWRAISDSVIPLSTTYDIAVAYAGPHDFISYYIVKYVNAQKKIQWIHFDVSKIFVNKDFGNEFYQSFDRIFCVSENALQVFKDTFPAVGHRSFVFRNIVTHESVIQMANIGRGFDSTFDGFKILTIGRLSQEKGQLMIPEVVYRLKKQNIRFRWYLIGDGDCFDQLIDLIQKYELEEYLILLGKKINPYKYLMECNLYVQTSLYEGYCITLHEAKVFNKPVVTTNFLSASNLISHERDGLIVDISVDGLYQGVSKIFQNPDLLFSFSRSIFVKNTTNETEKLFF